MVRVNWSQMPEIVTKSYSKHFGYISGERFQLYRFTNSERGPRSIGISHTDQKEWLYCSGLRKGKRKVLWIAIINNYHHRALCLIMFRSNGVH